MKKNNYPKNNSTITHTHNNYKILFNYNKHLLPLTLYTILLLHYFHQYYIITIIFIHISLKIINTLKQ